MQNMNYQHTLAQVEFWLDRAAAYERHGQHALSRMAYEKAEKYDDELYHLRRLLLGEE